MSWLKISTRSRYALRFVVEVASQDIVRGQLEHRGRIFISIREAANRQDISWRYLEQVAPALINDKILESVRGPAGGYRLARPANKITVADVLRSTEMALSSITCVDSPGECDRQARCPTTRFWQGLSDAVGQYLESVTIADLLQETDHEGVPIFQPKQPANVKPKRPRGRPRKNPLPETEAQKAK